ncbi:lysylphosphatidylglycerol synthase domain-containing protein [Spirulina sp. CS-785/01]|uniref:lysylphosphatidylglycerol synthase domain-containing protein n=1 Tax=Spirulina sp. CS-785/01 TaxID=3021716 RepID=UPI00232AAA21|nr:lysylphosphatidylglycerol synthase domain-containing protein [Spirulina sp. CS-785/01]MDB9315920.1 lysylphosphatidylglycerol synthase domain-containing protein [Spirulina sp. CS-785/01]
MKSHLPRVAQLKPYLRWLVWGGVSFFLVKTLHTHWQTVVNTEISGFNWGYAILAFLVTLLAHCWTGWVWGLILRYLNYPVSGVWSIRVYLQTNIAKYVPGNVWHFYGRVRAAQQLDIPLPVATLSVLLEPLLMLAAALLLALFTYPQANLSLQLLILGVVLLGVHPVCLNPLLHWAGKLKGRKNLAQHPPENSPPQPESISVKYYPLMPFLGECCFLWLRGSGFLLTVLALQPLTWEQIPPLVSTFSLAWLLGLVVPGSPGGIGVFETTAIALLQGNFFLSIALYRLISTLAEAIGAFLATVNAKSRTQHD